MASRSCGWWSHRLTDFAVRFEPQGSEYSVIYPSPGGSSERINLFWGEVDASYRTVEGGGIRSEGEDTQVVVLPLRMALDMIGRGEMTDAKTIVALQHLALLQAQSGCDEGERSDG